MEFNNPDYVSRKNNYKLSHYDYPADTMPLAYSDWGTVSLAAFLGCEQVCSEDTIWYEPCLNSLEDNIIYNPHNETF